MLKMVVLVAALVTAAAVQAQPAAGKKELVARVLQLQQGGVEQFASSVAAAPAMQLQQRAGMALQNLPAERREAVARDIEADLRKYVEEATPLVRERAVKLWPSTIGALLEERFTEDELKQILVLLESPVNRKYQAMQPEMQRAIGEKLVAETRGEIEPKVRALEQTIGKRLAGPGGNGGAAAPGSGLKPPPAPGASAPRK